ncbi:MAG: hypothetical protein WDO71_21690 [Bacteroidota bacterium]
MADMGHYSLWTVFNALKLTSPTVIEPHRSHVCGFRGAVPYRINNDFSFPMASTVRFSYPAMVTGHRWNCIGMMEECGPPIPAELTAENKELPQEGMMFVGDKGKNTCRFQPAEPADNFR